MVGSLRPWTLALLSPVSCALGQRATMSGFAGLKAQPGFQPSDPFLMVGFHNDIFPPRSSLRSTPGFPNHPHCGFETLTLMISGVTDHADSLGGRGRYAELDMQWCGQRFTTRGVFCLQFALGTHRESILSFLVG